MRVVRASKRFALIAALGCAWPSLTSAAETTDEDAKSDKEKRGNPALVIAGGPMIGPHAIGNEDCRPEESECQVTGAFFGAGAQLEIRPQIYEILYLHARPFIVGNGARDKVYSGAWGVAGGLGVYGQHVFGRAEYVFIDAFGDNTFAPPFFTERVARDDFGYHAGALSVGFRLQVKDRVGVELWGGPMFGPTSVRRIPGEDPERRTLITFMLGFSVSVDVVKARHR
jgi:hypothetical protein